MIIETTNFRLNPSADIDAFLAADRQIQCDFAYRQTGLLRRTTARSTGGEWMVVDLWSSEREADACAEQRDASQLEATFRSFVDATTVRTQRYATLD